MPLGLPQCQLPGASTHFPPPHTHTPYLAGDGFLALLATRQRSAARATNHPGAAGPAGLQGHGAVPLLQEELSEQGRLRRAER